MAVGPKMRFEVFKRDDFTCQYCGRKTPKVILECDHVVPRAEGGLDEIENLITSCFECNRGKGATLLGELPPSADVHERTVLIAEREMQIREYNAVRAAQREREDREIAWLQTRWSEHFHGDGPSEAALRRYLQTLSVYDVGEVIEMVWSKSRAGKITPPGVIPYFFGVLKHKVGDEDA